tara:strand:+ start:6374 stop:7063 length:690 start_codon:yes stop_codon:yes gene_type:complete
MKISSLLNKDWHYDDSPHHWSGVIDPSDLVNWSEVEYCLNHPEHFDIKFIDRYTNHFIDYPRYQRAWIGQRTAEVQQLMDIYREGHTCIIEKFEYINNSKFTILDDLENVFNIHASMHVYCGLANQRSFNIHEDYANNLIIQVEGETHWKVYNNRASNLISQLDFREKVDETKLDVAIDVILKPGDIIYIPARCYHLAQPQDKRLSLSIPMQHLVNLKKVDRNYYALPT